MGLKQHNDVANYKYQAGDICVIEYTIHEQGDNVAQLHSIIRAEFETQGLRFSNDTFYGLSGDAFRDKLIYIINFMSGCLQRGVSYSLTAHQFSQNAEGALQLMTFYNSEFIEPTTRNVK